MPCNTCGLFSFIRNRNWGKENLEQINEHLLPSEGSFNFRFSIFVVFSWKGLYSNEKGLLTFFYIKYINFQSKEI